MYHVAEGVGSTLRRPGEGGHTDQWALVKRSRVITINQRNHTGSYVRARNDRLQTRFSCAVH